MFSAQNYLKGRERHKEFQHEFTDQVKKNADRMIAATAEILSAFGSKRDVVHGWTPKNIAKRDGLDPVSPHHYAQAVALEDFDGRLGQWALLNIERLVEMGVYLQSLAETREGDRPFVRFQIVRPRCGNRIFSCT
jgi:hypothetical protein